MWNAVYGISRYSVPAATPVGRSWNCLAPISTSPATTARWHAIASDALDHGLLDFLGGRVLRCRLPTTAAAPSCTPASAAGRLPTGSHGSAAGNATAVRQRNRLPPNHASPAVERFGVTSGRFTVARSNRHRPNQYADAPSSHR